MLHAIIMAGGSGTRFWPASRADRPKQLLDLVDGQTMIQATLARLQEWVPAERVLVVTNVRLADAIAGQLPELPTGAVLGEPCRRDTAPCIGLASIQICQQDEDATMVVMPADHVIHPTEKFRAAVTYAAELVEQRPDRLVTFGICPTYPAESFGYIERGEPLTSDSTGPNPPAYSVRQFREKPQAEVARSYLESGTFYWNSGIFVWKAAKIMRELAQHEPAMFKHLETISAAWGTSKYDDVLKREFAAIQGKSIDYAVMERADDVVVVEVPFEWDDVGSWQAIARLTGTDAEGNTIFGRHLGLDTQGSIVRTDDEHLVVTLGVKDCVVVHTENATLVANKHDEEAVRKVVELLKENQWNEFL